MIYVISKSTFGSYEVRDIQCNANWCSCPYSDYALIPDDLVEGVLATQGYCDIVLNDDGTEIVSFTAREIPSVPEECCGTNTVLSVNGAKANSKGEIWLPRNLLDNSDFTNPVNQRGLTTASALNIEYFIDRWLGYGAGASYGVSAKKLAITNDGSATCGFIQRVSVDALTAGKTYTLAMKAKVSGSWYLSYGNNATSNAASSDALDNNIEKVHIFSFVLPESTSDVYNFRIRSSAVTGTAEVVWAALYEGEYTADTLPEYQPKGYAAEMAECRRYFRCKTNALLNVMFAASLKSVQVCMENDEPFVSVPTFTVDKISWIRGNGKAYGDIPSYTTSVYSNNKANPVFSIDFVSAFDQTAYGSAFMYASYTLSADL